MRAHADDFAKPVTLEMGKLIGESLGEVALSADIIDYYATNAERFLATEKLKPGTGEAERRCQSVRRAVWRAAVEFSVLPARAFCRAQFDGRQCRDGETCGLRAAMRHRI